MISKHGVPLKVHTDQGKNFEFRIFREMARLLEIRKTRTTALHPQSDGQIKHQHQTILNYLSKFVAENQRDWDRWIPLYLLAYRTSKHETAGVTPAELYFARDLRLPVDLLRGNSPGLIKADSIGYLGGVRKKLEEIHENVRERLDIRFSRVKTLVQSKGQANSVQSRKKGMVLLSSKNES